ncbi:MAG: 23S rRNA (pseudouridine(1915)-N(3))-methyltransferase RlmH [Candidatus Melainabacteria bacterium]
MVQTGFTNAEKQPGLPAGACFFLRRTLAVSVSAFPPVVVLAVGKFKQSNRYLAEGVETYLKRLKPYMKVSVVEVAEETLTPSRTVAQVMAAEGDRLLKYIPAQYQEIIALSEHGSTLTSPAFSTRLFGDDGSNPSNGGVRSGAQNPIIFIVGGPYGLAPKVLAQSHWVCSLSPMTFPHPVVRLLLLEQLYRAVKIHRGEAYHK